MSLIRHVALAAVAGLAYAVLPGCATPPQNVLPNGAINVESGNGSMHFMAPADGTVYVYEPVNQHLIWSGPVTRNQAVDVDPPKDEIVVGGRVAATGALQANARNEVYFEPSPVVEPQPVPAAHVQPPQTPENGSAYNTGVILTPNVSVQPSANSSVPGTVEVQPGLRVSPATRPTTQP